MRSKAPWFLAAVSLFSSAAAAQTWVINTEGLFLQQPGKPRVAVKLPQWQWAHEPFACAPGVATGPRGETIVTSNVAAVVWRIEPTTLAVSLHRLELDADADKDVGFSGLVYSEREGAYFAISEHHGSLWRIDPLLRRAQRISLSEPLRGACSLSLQREERNSRFSRICVEGGSVHISPDQRAAYVQAAGCTADAFAYRGGAR